MNLPWRLLPFVLLLPIVALVATALIVTDDDRPTPRETIVISDTKSRSPDDDRGADTTEDDDDDEEATRQRSRLASVRVRPDRLDATDGDAGAVDEPVVDRTDDAPAPAPAPVVRSGDSRDASRSRDSRGD